jgi:heme/copper-type cytochrome/quinol oxidase subunit 2
MVPAPLLWICAFVAAAVFAVMIHSIATFRRSGAEPGMRPSALREIFWAIVPMPAVRMLASQHATNTVQAHNDP